jgi:CpeT protein
VAVARRRRSRAWRREAPLADLGPDDLTEREGCTIYLLQRADGAFEGSTLGRLCTSTLRGATWATSEVVITADGMVSWDRGWNDDGEQV